MTNTSKNITNLALDTLYNGGNSKSSSYTILHIYVARRYPIEDSTVGHNVEKHVTR